MPIGRYNFATLFLYNLETGLILPKYRIVINGVLLEQGVPITPVTDTGGVNLFGSTNKAFVGSWDPATRIMTISGVYQ